MCNPLTTAVPAFSGRAWATMAVEAVKAPAMPSPSTARRAKLKPSKVARVGMEFTNLASVRREQNKNNPSSFTDAQHVTVNAAIFAVLR